MILNAGGILVPSGATASITRDGGELRHPHRRRRLGLCPRLWRPERQRRVLLRYRASSRPAPARATFAAGSLDRPPRTAHRPRRHRSNINDILANVRRQPHRRSLRRHPHLRTQRRHAEPQRQQPVVQPLRERQLSCPAPPPKAAPSPAPRRPPLTIRAAAPSPATSPARSRSTRSATTRCCSPTPTPTPATRSSARAPCSCATAPRCPTSRRSTSTTPASTSTTATSAASTTASIPTATINLRGGDFVHPRPRRHAHPADPRHRQPARRASTSSKPSPAAAAPPKRSSATSSARPARWSSFNQNYGFLGTAGNDTTAIRYLLDAHQRQPIARRPLNNGILAGWANVNNDHFAT